MTTRMPHDSRTVIEQLEGRVEWIDSMIAIRRRNVDELENEIADCELDILGYETEKRDAENSLAILRAAQPAVDVG